MHKQLLKITKIFLLREKNQIDLNEREIINEQPH
jgi:hypothetical protein